MPLTRPFKETVMERLRTDAGFRNAMLHEGITTLLSGELNVGKSILRDYINATIGFEKLAKTTKIPPKSLMRMLGRSGNPNTSNLVAIIGALRAYAGIDLNLHIAAE